MWVPRDFKPLNESLSKRRNGADYVGRNGATQRLGRGMRNETTPPSNGVTPRR